MVRAIDKGCLQKDDRPAIHWAVNPKLDKSLFEQSQCRLELAARISKGHAADCEMPAERTASGAICSFAVGMKKRMQDARAKSWATNLATTSGTLRAT
jgi:hypothetical protein